MLSTPRTTDIDIAAYLLTTGHELKKYDHDTNEFVFDLSEDFDYEEFSVEFVNSDMKKYAGNLRFLRKFKYSRKS